MMIDILIFILKKHITIELIPKCFSESKMIVEIRNDNCVANRWILMMSKKKM